jgi:hypothetical protein
VGTCNVIKPGSSPPLGIFRLPGWPLYGRLVLTVRAYRELGRSEGVLGELLQGRFSSIGRLGEI